LRDLGPTDASRRLRQPRLQRYRLGNGTRELQGLEPRRTQRRLHGGTASHSTDADPGNRRPRCLLDRAVSSPSQLPWTGGMSMKRGINRKERSMTRHRPAKVVAVCVLALIVVSASYASTRMKSASSGPLAA